MLRKEPVERARHRWEYNIKMDLKEIERGSGAPFIRLRIGASGKML